MHNAILFNGLDILRSEECLEGLIIELGCVIINVLLIDGKETQKQTRESVEVAELNLLRDTLVRCDGSFPGACIGLEGNDVLASCLAIVLVDGTGWPSAGSSSHRRSEESDRGEDGSRETHPGSMEGAEIHLATMFAETWTVVLRFICSRKTRAKESPPGKNMKHVVGAGAIVVS